MARLADHITIGELSARSGVATSALRFYEQRGLISRRKGEGTYVCHDQPGLWLLQSSEGFFRDEVGRRGSTVTSQILRAEAGALPVRTSRPRRRYRAARPDGLTRVSASDHVLAVTVDDIGWHDVIRYGTCQK